MAMWIFRLVFITIFLLNYAHFGKNFFVYITVGCLKLTDPIEIFFFDNI